MYTFLFLSCCVHNTLPCLTHQFILYTVLFKEIIYNSYQNVYAEVVQTDRQTDGVTAGCSCSHSDL